MNRGELRDCWKRLQIAKEAAEDVAFLVARHDPELAARITQIAKAIEHEISVIAQHIKTARAAEKGTQQ